PAHGSLPETKSSITEASVRRRAQAQIPRTRRPATAGTSQNSGPSASARTDKTAIHGPTGSCARGGTRSRVLLSGRVPLPTRGARQIRRWAAPLLYLLYRAVGETSLLEVLLVVLFGLPEFGGGDNLGHDRLLIGSGLLKGL